MGKKSEKTKLIKKMDVLWSLIIRTRDNYQCQKEGCPAHGKRNAQAAHIWARGHKKTRWEIDDGITLCYYHHILWAHRQPLEFAEWIKQRIGEKKYFELRDRAYQDLEPVSMEDLIRIEKGLENLLEQFQRENHSRPF